MVSRVGNNVIPQGFLRAGILAPLLTTVTFAFSPLLTVGVFTFNLLKTIDNFSSFSLFFPQPLHMFLFRLTIELDL
jgi:hypothetical protein